MIKELISYAKDNTLLKLSYLLVVIGVGFNKEIFDTGFEFSLKYDYTSISLLIVGFFLVAVASQLAEKASKILKFKRKNYFDVIYLSFTILAPIFTALFAFDGFPVLTVVYFLSFPVALAVTSLFRGTVYFLKKK